MNRPTPHVEITDPLERRAAAAGELGECDQYEDGALYVKADALEAWRAARAAVHDGRWD